MSLRPLGYECTEGRSNTRRRPLHPRQAEPRYPHAMATPVGTKLDRGLTGGLSATFTPGPAGQLADAKFRRTLDHLAAAETFPGPLETLRLSSSAPGSSRGVPRYPQVWRCRRLDAFPASTTRREKTMNNIQQWFRREGLTRPRHSRLLAGVVAGLGRRIGIDPWPARLLFVLLALALHGGLILPYVILWILMPLDETQSATVWPPEPPVSPTR